MKNIRSAVAGVALIAMTSGANAALINFTGTIDNHNDVIYTYFTINQDTDNVRVWTDSFKEGANFDPITALWTGGGSLLYENDDNDSINPATQTYYDSGFSLDTLAAGDYVFTVATYENFARGQNLSDGFRYDSETPIALANWDQPANSIGMGPAWSVWLDGVDSASNPGDPGEPNEPGDPTASVPEPGSLALIGLGLLGLGFSRKHKAAKA